MIKNISESMKEYAEMAVQFAKNFYETDLDYSEDSLQKVDEVIAAYRSGQVFDPKELTREQEEDLWIFSKMIGGYVGEVIIRNLGGAWLTRKLDDLNLSIELQIADQVEGSPPEMVFQCLTEPFRTVEAYYQEAKKSLSVH
ncbi:hypothetical protein SAMN02745216_04646 [Desulfatibacillum alkenivorans DSM 16219]|jgi:hypothetical protein|uniref:DUF3806 domain-containing protein n=1 Tax=Desulfatibacillum alkenivorans DSM 16219 TaxID=1121393 RepID=A0A1M6Y0T6_9BACT|nr:hypothetical protein [Desulfatibacillum alkenivorans]SHL11788.1 hypothetical protein SAMN02745216_04646 [Desulfatibacillum alkenivorans DSM 16219]